MVTIRDVSLVEANNLIRLMMSALGQKRTCAVQNGMSALPPIADMCGATRDVRFVPCVDGSELARTFFTFAALVGAAMCSAC
jgi:hypothetical protein